MLSSVLPPPPRYPSQMLYNGAYLSGQMVPMIETNNILSHPTGPDCQFLVGEGLYVLEEDLLLATPPPHPSETPVVNPNPLATTPLPATAGTKISMVALVDPPPPPALALLLSGANSTAPPADNPGSSSGPFATVEEHPDGESSSSAPTGNAAGDSATGRLSFNTNSAMSAGSDTALAGAAASGAAPGTAADATAGGSNPLTANGFNHSATSTTSALATLASMGGTKASGGKQRKPKNNVTKSNSSFISRVIVNDNLAKRLQDRPATGIFVFANINRAFQWVDMSSETKKDYFTKILFTKAHCLCHDINPVTKSTSHLDVIMGFSTGELIWWEPFSQRYMRLNKNGIIRGTPVSDVRWVPGSENLFMAAFMDGSLVVFDKEKEDAAFVFDEDEANRQRLSNSTAARAHIQVERSIHTKGQKSNPFAFWKLSNQRINAFAFSPQANHVAVVSEDGSLRIIDILREELLGLFYSYYGGLTCVCWSPDGKYVVTGGQDDLLSIWHVADQTLVARCQGHHSWVTSVAFDPWRCDDRVYRIGSVGEDSRLCLWDFSVGMLTRPKATTSTSNSNIHTATSTGKTVGRGSEEDADGYVMVDESNGGDERVHPVEPRARTAILPPVCSQVVDKDPLCWLGFTESAIMISSKTGHIRTWKRPTDSAAQAP
ncbi:catabolite repression protein creC [Sporothrix schenckii 1099-18]|uniref:Catabolite repression protein creC n=1 Tax=Sporothrix schenckii 1099-18 TaxID=1397361 RepID=A0A0F2LVT2_SPOSC|nr:catabolite repression protein creC [Sporothrix schenckii 1099-18]KJR80939.1 catabolite repression protein creC [Sporothrix schenckii 1099-18]